MKKYIQGEEISVTEKELKVDDLEFWAENPRVYSALRASGDENPTQPQIEEVMTKMDHVKSLKASIKVHGGLMQPVFVRRNVVVEGNCRLAAYRLLCRTTEKVKWAKIRCYVLPDDMSDDLVFSLIATLHIDGVKEWTPFEQAGYLVRHIQKSKKPIEVIAKNCGLSLAKAKQYIAAYEMMLDNEDTDQQKWSYYFEMLKNKSIPTKSESHPELNLIENLCKKIKFGEINNAQDMRMVAKLAGANSAEANKALHAYLQGDESLESAVAKVSEDDKKRHAKNVAQKFREQLVDKDFMLLLMDNDDEFKYEMERIYGRLK